MIFVRPKSKSFFKSNIGLNSIASYKVIALNLFCLMFVISLLSFFSLYNFCSFNLSDSCCFFFILEAMLIFNFTFHITFKSYNERHLHKISNNYKESNSKGTIELIIKINFCTERLRATTLVFAIYKLNIKVTFCDHQ